MKISNNTPIGDQYDLSGIINTTGGWGTGTLSTIYSDYFPKTVVEVKVDEETIEVIYVQRAKNKYTVYNSGLSNVNQIYNPDRTYKEIYGCKEGKLTLLKTIEGRIVPPTLKESYDFPKE
jgi:hypothetical protein